MSSTLRSVWETVVGLLVDDGQLAIGIVASLAIVWVVAATGSVDLRNDAGWLLLLMLVLLVVANLNIAGRKARRKSS